MEIFSYGLSFVGRRPKNQDSISRVIIDESKSVYFFAVADGMGGGPGGEIASQTVIDTCEDFLTSYFSSNSAPFNLKYALGNAIRTADNKLVELAKKRSELKGMGTTLTCILIAGDKYVAGNIGDSRTYYYNSQMMTQITRDHSAIEDYRQEHGNDLDAALVRNYGHIITRSLGPGRDEPDIFPLDGESYQLKENTGFLLCSDGLIVDKGETDPTEFHNYCIGKKALKDSVESLIGYAYYNGSTDNISIICIEIGRIKRKKISLPIFAYPPKENKKQVTIKSRPKKAAIIPFLLAGILIIVALLIVQTWEKPREDTLSVTENEVATIEVNKIVTTKKLIAPVEDPTIINLKFLEKGFPNYKKAFLSSDTLLIHWQTQSNDKDIKYEVRYWISEKDKLADWEDVGSDKEKKIDINNFNIASNENTLHWQVKATYKDSAVESPIREIEIKKNE